MEENLTSASFEEIQRCYDAMAAFGKKNLRDRSRSIIEGGGVTRTGPGQKLSNEATPLVAAQLRADLDAWDSMRSDSANKRLAQLLKEIGPELAAAVAVTTTLNIVATGKAEDRDINRIRRAVGRACATEARAKACKKNTPTAWKWAQNKLKAGGATRRLALAEMHDRLDEAHQTKWDSRDCMLLGAALLRVVERRTGLVTAKAVGRKQFVEMSAEVADWIKDSIESMVDHRRSKLPVLHEPTDWSLNDNLGGYLAGFAPQLPILLRGGKGRAKKAIAEAGPVLDAVNVIQRTPFRINLTVRRALNFALSKGFDDVGLPSSAGSEPEWTGGPDPDRQSPEWKEYRSARRRWHEDAEKERADRAALSRTLTAVRQYEGDHRWWLPHQMDYRGRVYPTSTGELTTQGPKYQRAMIEFARGVRLGKCGLSALRFSAANAWGEDKLTLEGRQQWAIDNEEMILSVGADFEADLRWRQADDPFGFVAVATEIHNAQQEGEDYISHLPVNYDGSSNGLQVLSLALLDQEGAEATNCVPTDEPSDIYMRTGAAMKEVLIEWRDEPGRATPKQREAAERFLRWIEAHCGGVIPRSYMKRPTMTTPYSAKDFSIQGYLTDAYHEQVKGMDIPESQLFLGKGAYQGFFSLVAAFREGQARVVNRASAAMDYFQEVASIAAKEGVHLSWSTPLGFRAQQDYYKSAKIDKVQVFCNGGQATQVSLPKVGTTRTVDRARSVNGIVPNWVHSMDACALQSTVLVGKEEGISDWLCIHDSIGTHAGNTDKLYRAIREGYRRTFESNVVQDFHDNVKRLLPECATLPEPPELGSLDIQDLLTADYFFA